jgi:hypothetical protein
VTAVTAPDPLGRIAEHETMLRPDAELAGLDVPAAISLGITATDASSQAMLTDAAIAAAIEAGALGVGPYPVAILARVVRAGGVVGALRLPEPLIGVEPAILARSWLEAALAAGGTMEADLVFSRWLELVATLIAVRRSARHGAGTPEGADPDA